MSKKPLKGVRVLDVTHLIAGPFCSMLLANAGAEVIKVEPPVVGERARRAGHPIQGAAKEPISLQYVRINRGKKGITLNLRSDAGKSLFRQLVKQCDVVVENFRPGAMKRLGLDYDSVRSLNPRLIYASISGFGKDGDKSGPYSNWGANNPSAQAMSGLMDITGEPGGPPSMVGASIGDTIPGLWTAYGILLALLQRERTGTGQYIDLAMYDCLVVHNDMALPFFDVYREVSGRSREDMWSPQLRLETSDGFMVLSGGGGPEKWTELWRAAGRPDLAEQQEYLRKDRMNGPFLFKFVKPELEKWTRTQEKLKLCVQLQELGFSAAMVQNAKEVYDCPQLESRNLFESFHFNGRQFRMPGVPIKLSDAPNETAGPPPMLGESNQEIFGDLLGIESSEIAELKANNII